MTTTLFRTPIKSPQLGTPRKIQLGTPRKIEGDISRTPRHIQDTQKNWDTPEISLGVPNSLKFTPKIMGVPKFKIESVHE